MILARHIHTYQALTINYDICRYVKRGVLYKGPVLEEIDQVNTEDLPWEGEDEYLNNPDPNRPRGRGYGAESYVQRLA